MNKLSKFEDLGRALSNLQQIEDISSGFIMNECCTRKQGCENHRDCTFDKFKDPHRRTFTTGLRNEQREDIIKHDWPIR